MKLIVDHMLGSQLHLHEEMEKKRMNSDRIIHDVIRCLHFYGTFLGYGASLCTWGGE